MVLHISYRRRVRAYVSKRRSSNDDMYFAQHDGPARQRPSTTDRIVRVKLPSSNTDMYNTQQNAHGYWMATAGDLQVYLMCSNVS